LLDDWLKRRVLCNQASGSTKTCVACHGDRVVAFYALASSAVATSAAPTRFRRNMPDPIPLVVLARLAVDRGHQVRGAGRALVRDTGKRVLYAAAAIGIRGLIVHALNDEAKAFYEALGFDPSPLDPMTLLITLTDFNANL